MSMVGGAKRSAFSFKTSPGILSGPCGPFCLSSVNRTTLSKDRYSETGAKLSFTALLEDTETILRIWIKGEWFYNKELELAFFWLY